MIGSSLNPRQQQVLTALVDHYIVRAEPVSSKILSESAVVRASSATIRNTLSDLENLGFVEQPHASAGRLPTDRGYRTYVDLMHPQPLHPDDRRALDIEPVPGESLEAKFSRTAKALADRTQLLGIVIPPPAREATFRGLTVAMVEEGRLALVLATSEHEIRSVWLEPGETSIFQLESVLRRLNEKMKGRPVSLLNGYFAEATQALTSKNEEIALNLVNRSILKLWQGNLDEEVFVAGAQNLVKRQNFTKIEDAAPVFELLDSKITLVHFLRQQADDTGVHVTIGEERRENGRLFRSLSLITAAFSLKEGSRGMVGVLGPKRIPYSRLVPVVSYAAQRLGRSGKEENGS
jgi:heat-inducible transcriptional repressor